MEGLIWTFNSRIVRDFAKWIHKMYTTRTRVGPVQVNNIVPATGGLAAGGGLTYLVGNMLVAVVLGWTCEYPMFQQHLGACRGGGSTTAVDIFFNAQNNFTKIAVYANDYREVSEVLRLASFDTATLSGTLRITGKKRDYIKDTKDTVVQYRDQLKATAQKWEEFSDTIVEGTSSLAAFQQYLDPYFRGVTGKMAFMWQSLGYPDKYALKRLERQFVISVSNTIEVLDEMHIKTDSTIGATRNLSLILDDLVDVMAGTVASIYEEQVVDGYFHAPRDCTLFTLCGLIGQPKPISVREMENVLKVLEETKDYSGRATVAIESIQEIVATAKAALTEARGNARQHTWIDWTEKINVLRQSLREWRNMSREHLAVLRELQKKYRTTTDRSRTPDRSVPAFYFPLLNIQGNQGSAYDYAEVYGNENSTETVSEQEDGS
ncbi:hypothetical protein PG996_004912 [Apiospora saccharicola]|uniref:Uncharacterized protein n=1 Tax=Apiospora saccharicola TaxID=335842 RepID=A0ABR1VJZ6_9PEZI